MSYPPPEPRLGAEDHLAFRRGVHEFNAGCYFECHDTLEDLWSGVRGPSRDFFQGLIQVSVGFYQLTRGNLAGAQSMFERALKRFERYPDAYFGFDLKRHRLEITEWLARVRSGDMNEISLASRPRWVFAEP